MGRCVDVEDLVGAADIAARLGVKRLQVIHDWRRRHTDFPRPMVSISRTLIWYWPDVRHWAVKTGRLDSDERPSVTHHREDGGHCVNGSPNQA